MPIQNIGLLGYGYVAKHFVSTFPNLTYHATVREGHRTVLKSESVSLYSYSESSIKKILSCCDAILISTPPETLVGDPVLNCAKELFAAMSSLKWVGYLSSTGVYGDHQGAWVNEESECRSITPRAQARILAEKQWLELKEEFNLPVNIFRLAGIYGPQRNILERIKSGKKTQVIVKQGQLFSRIHVDDTVSILRLSMLRPSFNYIYNLADDCPAGPEEVDDFACRLLNHPLLEKVNYLTANLSRTGKNFYESNRRVSNYKIKKSLNYNMKYPSYREGLVSLLD